MIKGLIFDCDGTLISLEKYLDIFCEMQREVHRKLGIKEIPEERERLYIPLRLPAQESNRFLREIWNVEPMEYWHRLFEYDIAERKKAGDNGMLWCYEDVLALRAIDLPKVILSNTPEEIIDLELDMFGIRDIFLGYVCSNYKSRFSKPERGGIQRCLKLLGARGEQVCMIGDAEIDILAGRKVGAVTIQVLRGHHNYEREKPDYKINSFYELKGVIEEINRKEREGLEQIVEL